MEKSAAFSDKWTLLNENNIKTDATFVPRGTATAMNYNYLHSFKQKIQSSTLECKIPHEVDYGMHNKRHRYKWIWDKEGGTMK